MPDKDMLNWIEDQQKKGFSNKQIRQTLFNQGYNTDSINNIFSSEIKESNTTSKTTYTIFYILFTILNPVLIIATFAIPFLTISGVIIYISTFLYAAIIGFVTAYVFYKNCDSSKEYINHTLALSIILAIILAIINIIGEVGIKLTQSFENIQQNTEQASPGFSMISMFNSQAISSNILHITTLIIFILPIIYYFIKRDDKQIKLLAFYIIPLAIYLLLILVLGLISNAVFSPISYKTIEIQ